MLKRYFVVQSGAVFLWLSLGIVPVGAQSFSVLHTFSPGKIQRPGLILTNSDGANPGGALAVSGATLYGAAKNGGTTGSGTLFAIDTNGANFKILYTFSSDLNTNSDGANPNGELLLAGGALYGVTFAGGGGDSGVVYSFPTNGATISSLYTFSATDPITGLNSDGAHPSAGLVLSGSTLFGTASAGGTGGSGALFAVSANGGSFKLLYQFSTLDPTTGTNTDGAYPLARLTVAGTTLFGTTSAGGINGYGTAFAINTDGTGITVLHHFDINTAKPSTELVLSGETLYGMADTVVFAINTNGSGFSILHQFGSRIDLASTATPGLTLSNGTFFGSAAGDGAFGSGQVFSLGVNGTGFGSLYDFTAESGPFPETNSDGAFPNGGLVALNGTAYGTTGEGGSGGTGVLFSLPLSSSVQILPPVLSAQLSAGNFIVGFQTSSGLNYSLQQTANLNSGNWTSYTNIVGNGASVQISIPITSPYQFFRAQVQ